MTTLWRNYSDYLSGIFPGIKVQKIAVNAGFSCPNRNGSKGRGGCTYCNNTTFNPAYCSPRLSVAQQMVKGRDFFARKYPEMKYLAYFQAYTNTHGPVDRVLGLYREALSQPDVVGLIIGTRPDCMPEALLEQLSRMRTEGVYIMIEYGAESSHDKTLRRVNRCHTWSDTADAVRRTHSAGIDTGLHLIMGLPGETREMMLATIDAVNALPVDTVKIHQLQLVRGTRMAADIEAGLYDIPRFTVEEYADLCRDIVRRLRSDIAIERFVSQSPADMLIYPRWRLKNYQFTNLLQQRLK